MASSSRVYHAILRRETIRETRHFVNQVLTEIEVQSKIIAGHGPYTTGHLAASIRTTGPTTTGFVVHGQVGTRVRYAKVVESGARVHNIFPKRAPKVYRFGRSRRPTLKFFWRKAGRTVFPNQIPMGPGTVGISHPGQKGKGFLIRPLRDAAVRHRMQIIVFDL
jgi:hypothetical protein